MYSFLGNRVIRSTCALQGWLLREGHRASLRPRDVLYRIFNLSTRSVMVWSDFSRIDFSISNGNTRRCVRRANLTLASHYRVVLFYVRFSSRYRRARGWIRGLSTICRRKTSDTCVCVPYRNNKFAVHAYINLRRTRHVRRGRMFRASYIAMKCVSMSVVFARKETTLQNSSYRVCRERYGPSI